MYQFASTRVHGQQALAYSVQYGLQHGPNFFTDPKPVLKRQLFQIKIACQHLSHLGFVSMNLFKIRSIYAKNT